MPPLMLFAAGLGTRMGALTADRPKPMIPVAGRPLIDYALAIARDAGAARIVANTHYLADRLVLPPDVIVSHEPELLETGGGLRAALPHLGADTVMTLNTDAVWTGENPLTQLQSVWEPERMDALLLLLPARQATGYRGPGDFNAGPVLSRGGDHAYLGAQIVKTDGLARIPDRKFSLNLLWDRMIAEGRLHGVIHKGGWCDVGRPESLPLAEALLHG
ncbi:nucleotidyltransferase family protein [Falsirhodobacter sp. 20TX0035]|uniref:nucleotidyltransferase family protein n=1 Tax=Falsirhodobacter sp. 20TX0035 TaxID=3022019 RepID=UPI00232D6341|nr:nucleotidyltransferase family protein [Falsirhodobacter sp. 20TX0035]MDB6452783.1 nucleotidyltransferase family protein [Falsirhodobacter sp. 20TX0035]